MIGRFELGRVYEGDGPDLLAELPYRSVAMIFSDPPFGNGNMDGDLAAARAAGKVKRSRIREAEPIANDLPEEYEPLMRRFLESAAHAVELSSAICVCVGGGGPVPTSHFLMRLVMERLAFEHEVIWNKLAQGPGLGWIYRRSYEKVIVSRLRAGSLRHPDPDRTLPNVVNFSPIRGESRLHPNQKPGALVRAFIELHTAPGDLIVDPFAGSGETGVQALRLGREFLGFELDPKWCALANERLAATRRGNDLASERAGQINLFGEAK